MKARTLFALLMVGMLSLAACSDEGGDGGSSPAAGGNATEQPSETAEEPMNNATVEVADSDLGEILVGADGLTAYVFFADQNGKSTCYDDCEAMWPPITVDGEPVAGDGVDASLLGTTERNDGTTQVTYDGQPLYNFGSDTAPGDTNGQDIGDVWYVVGPDGAPIEDEKAEAANSDDDRGGY